MRRCQFSLWDVFEFSLIYAKERKSAKIKKNVVCKNCDAKLIFTEPGSSWLHWSPHCALRYLSTANQGSVSFGFGRSCHGLWRNNGWRNDEKRWTAVIKAYYHSQFKGKQRACLYWDDAVDHSLARSVDVSGSLSDADELVVCDRVAERSCEWTVASVRWVRVERRKGGSTVVAVISCGGGGIIWTVQGAWRFVCPVSSEISDLCEISDLLLFVNYFASQSKRIEFGSYFLMCAVLTKTFRLDVRYPQQAIVQE